MLRLRLIMVAALGLLPMFSVSTATADAADQPKVGRPNVVWIVSEDNSAHWLGCYGNAEAKTPRLDALAADSVQFNHAYSGAPVCAVARAGLLHGMYSVTLGTQHMRSRHAIPEKFTPYVSHLREQGYYCTNASKTDYNRKGDDKSIWDECSREAHYKNREAGQPFFAIFNDTVSHESSLFEKKINSARKQGLIPVQTRLDAASLALPPYLPDLPEVRSDIAIYHDVITALDTKVGKLLDELNERGLADDTIVFYYSDHGGILPRGKRYLKQTGVQVPLLVHVPEKWKHLSPFKPVQQTDQLVAFVDFAPTLLSLCGIEPPDNMQGRAFMGPHQKRPGESPIVFLFADRFDEKIGMRRGLTDGRYKYIRRFLPHLPAAPYSSYQFGQSAWRAWQTAWQVRKLPPEFARIWETPQQVEELYNLKNDPWEINNLAGEASHAERLGEYRNRLQQQMIATRDIGVIPEAMFKQLAGDGTINEYAQSEQMDYQRVLEAAMLASSAEPENLQELTQLLESSNQIVRYWAATGCAILGEQAASAAPRLESLLSDSAPTVRIMAAAALARCGNPDQSAKQLLSELDENLSGEERTLLLNTCMQLGCAGQIPTAWLQKNVGHKYEYVRRLSTQLLAQRSP